MKILYIATDIAWGGSSVALYNIIRELKEQHEIMVLLPNCKGRFGQELKKIGIKCFEKPLGEFNIYPNCRNLAIIDVLKRVWWFFRGFYRRYWAKKYVAELLDTYKPDIVHCNVGPIDISLDACIKRGIIHVWHLREYQDLDFSMHYFPSKKHFRNRILKKGNYCISISHDIFSHWGLRPGIDRVIYDGVILSGSKSLQLKKENYFLFVGRVQIAKGVLDAIMGFCDFCKKIEDYKLVIAGNWDTSFEYKKSCDKFIAENDLTESVVFLGQRNDVNELMAKATAILVTSYCEGFGFITAEAMYNNCIVIGRNTGGTKEQFDIGLNETGKEIGLRFNTVEEISHLMVRTAREDLSEMSDLAYRTVLRHYTTNICSEQVETFYRELLNKHE